MAADISGLAWFLPILGFMFVFLIVYALLKKTQILGENGFINIFISFTIATMFSSFGGVGEYVETVIPWFVVLIIALFLIGMIVAMAQADITKVMDHKIAWVFIILLIIVFVWSAIVVFSSTAGEFFEEAWDYIKTEDRVIGTALLLLVAAAASFLITKKN